MSKRQFDSESNLPSNDYANPPYADSGPHQPRDRVAACPDCDSAVIYARVSNRIPESERWRCSICQSTFETPTFRKHKAGGDQIGTAPDDEPDEPDADESLIDACPACLSCRVNERQAWKYDGDENWACYECGEEFAEPERRPPQRRHN